MAPSPRKATGIEKEHTAPRGTRKPSDRPLPYACAPPRPLHPPPDRRHQRPADALHRRPPPPPRAGGRSDELGPRLRGPRGAGVDPPHPRRGDGGDPPRAPPRSPPRLGARAPELPREAVGAGAGRPPRRGAPPRRGDRAPPLSRPPLGDRRFPRGARARDREPHPGDRRGDGVRLNPDPGERRARSVRLRRPAAGEGRPDLGRRPDGRLPAGDAPARAAGDRRRGTAGVGARGERVRRGGDPDLQSEGRERPDLRPLHHRGAPRRPPRRTRTPPGGARRLSRGAAAATGGGPMIRLEGVTVNAGSFTLRDISLEVPAGGYAL